MDKLEMSSGRDYMMDKWAEEYQLKQQRKEKQMAFEFDYEELRERELKEYREWVEEKECND